MGWGNSGATGRNSDSGWNPPAASATLVSSKSWPSGRVNFTDPCVWMDPPILEPNPGWEIRIPSPVSNSAVISPAELGYTGSSRWIRIESDTSGPTKTYPESGRATATAKRQANKIWENERQYFINLWTSIQLLNRYLVLSALFCNY